MVIWLTTKLQKQATKQESYRADYGEKANRYLLVLNKNTTSDQCGDEPLLIWQRTGAPVAVNPCRSHAVSKLLHECHLDIMLSDDGLQYHALGRDIE